MIRACASNLGVSLLALGVVTGADAADRTRAPPGQVTSCSNHGHGCYSGPVRQGPRGLEFRMPGGTWLPCRGNCKDAMREETVDFWEEQMKKLPSGGDFSK
jgi:hypothetical protein